MSNGLKVKKKKEEKEDKSFKFSDHLQNDPLEIVKLFVGKDISKEIPLRKIDTIISVIYSEPKVKVKKVKKIPSPIPHWEPPSWGTAIPTWITGTPDHIPDVDMADDEADIDDMNDFLMEDPQEEAQTTPLVNVFTNPLAEYLVKEGRRSGQIEKEKPKESLTMKEALEESYSTFRYNYAGNPALVKGYIIEGKYYTSDEDIEELIKGRSTTIDYNRVKAVCKVFKLSEGIISSKYIVKSNIKFQGVNKAHVYIPILPILVRLKLESFENSNNFASKEDHKKLREELVSKNLWNLNWKLENVAVVRQKTKLTTYVISVEDPESKEEVKFVYTDCDFKNPSGKGYNIPIDKSITTRSIVEVRKDKLHKYGFKEGENTEAQVIRIKPSPSSKPLFFGSNTRRKDVVKIKLLNNARGASVYAEDLKFIRSKQENYVNAKKEEGSKQGYSYQGLNPDQFEQFFNQNIQWMGPTQTITHP